MTARHVTKALCIEERPGAIRACLYPLAPTEAGFNPSSFLLLLAAYAR